LQLALRPYVKSATCEEAFNPNGLAQRAISLLKVGAGAACQLQLHPAG